MSHDGPPLRSRKSQFFFIRKATATRLVRRQDVDSVTAESTCHCVRYVLVEEDRIGSATQFLLQLGRESRLHLVSNLSLPAELGFDLVPVVEVVGERGMDVG